MGLTGTSGGYHSKRPIQLRACRVDLHQKAASFVRLHAREPHNQTPPALFAYLAV